MKQLYLTEQEDTEYFNEFNMHHVEICQAKDKQWLMLIDNAILILSFDFKNK